MKKMLKLLSAIVFMLISFVVCGSAATASNNLYTATISTFASTNAYRSSDINQAAVYVRSIDITNTSATEQTITFYKNGNSTTTIEAVYVFEVPATAGTFSVPLFNGISSPWEYGAESVNIPYFTARTSVDANAAKINVKYWK